MEGKEVNVNWNQFEVSAAKSFKDLWNNNNFTDVTLASEDDQQIRAHKVILSSCSNFFSSILVKNPHPSPLIYLKGIRYKELELMMKFLYLGQCQVGERDLEGFLATGKALEIQGLVAFESTISERNVDVENFNKDVFSNNYETVASAPTNALTHDVPNTNSKITDPEFESEDLFVNLESTQEPPEQVHDASNKSAKSKEIYQNITDRTQKEFPYKCNLCPKSYTAERSLATHMGTAHKGIRFKCIKCDFRAKHRVSLRLHTNFIHEGIGYNCDKCDRQFSQKHGLIKHKKVVHNQKVDNGENGGILYGCNTCNYQSIILKELIYHKNNLHK